MNATMIQLIRFGVVGTISNGFGFLLYLLLTWAGMGPKAAMSLLFVIGMLQTFVFNKRWTFEHGGERSSAFYRYCAAYGFGYLLNLAVLFLLVDRLHFPHQIIQGAMILLLAMMLFLLQKFWVFRMA